MSMGSTCYPLYIHAHAGVEFKMNRQVRVRVAGHGLEE
jgi:hypothetical protein